MTNKELQEWLAQFPGDAKVVYEELYKSTIRYSNFSAKEFIRVEFGSNNMGEFCDKDSDWSKVDTRTVT